MSKFYSIHSKIINPSSKPVQINSNNPKTILRDYSFNVRIVCSGFTRNKRLYSLRINCFSKNTKLMMLSIIDAVTAD